jgi:glycosyltransferase involved in cell wall biosynthesis
LAEYVQHGKTGLIFEEKDSTQLANFMIELIENNSKTLEMGQLAYHKLVTEMTLDKTCTDIHEIYKSFIK